MKNSLLIVCLSVLLASCGTSVPLNDVPVTEATSKNVADGNASATAGATSQSAVAPVVVPESSANDAINALTKVVYFDLDSYVVKPEFQSVMAEHARFIRAGATRKVVIEGHTDETGGREYNLALGQKRAEAVVSALTILGVPAAQLEAVSFGKEKPAVMGSDESAWSKNRRAEVRYQ